MIIKMTTEEFSALTLAGKKKILSQFLGNKVNEIVSGCMVNCEFGEYRVRHDGCAYSNIKIQPSECGGTELTVFNFRTKQWQSEAV